MSDLRAHAETPSIPSIRTTRPPPCPLGVRESAAVRRIERPPSPDLRLRVAAMIINLACSVLRSNGESRSDEPRPFAPPPPGALSAVGNIPTLPQRRMVLCRRGSDLRRARGRTGHAGTALGPAVAGGAVLCGIANAIGGERGVGPRNN